MAPSPATLARATASPDDKAVREIDTNPRPGDLGQLDTTSTRPGTDAYRPVRANTEGLNGRATPENDSLTAASP